MSKPSPNHLYMCVFIAVFVRMHFSIKKRKYVCQYQLHAVRISTGVKRSHSTNCC
jgi:hypothetical protein